MTILYYWSLVIVSIDLFDIALERLTDFTDFESLATEIMYLEGWVDIKPLGGVSDLGQDAVSEQLYRQAGDVERTVFQYTLQDYLPGKVTGTIDKLRANKIAFVELIVVTPHEISSEAQIRMKRDARTTYGVSLQIYERKTLITRLADLKNGIFNRHFANIKAQLEDVTRAAAKGSLPVPSLERALLQVSLALTFRPDSQRARKSVFDYFILALLLAAPDQRISNIDAAARAKSALNSRKDISIEQVAAAVGRLEKVGLVRSTDGVISATEAALAAIATGTVRLNEATSSFAADMISEVRAALGKNLSVEAERRIARNTREVLLEIARSRGMTVEANLVSVDERVAIIAKQQLASDIGNALTGAFAEALRSPTEEQASTLARWTQTYLAFAVMGLDPTLNAFQADRFNRKTFLLDTDVVLEALIGDSARSAGLRALIESLADSGSKLIIPESVLAECVGHAERSPRTYKFFGSALLQLTPALIEQQVWNAFVKGYYYAQLSKRISSSVGYSDYLSNFYEPRDPHKFLRAVIKEVLPDCIEVLPLEKMRPQELTDEEIEFFAARLQEDLAGSRKSRFRTQEDEASLARTDATLFLTTLRMNPRDESTATDVLGGTCYLVSETPRYSRVARSLGVSTTVTVRPSALASVQSLIGGFDISPTAFVQLFDNPFLESAVGAAWPDIEKLVRSGISLRGKSLPRLRFDLDEALHARVVSLSEAEEAEDTDSQSGHSSGEKFIELLTTASKRGYSLIPEVEALRVQIESSERRARNLEAVLDEATTQNQALQEQISFFGKRRQRYLRRMARNAPKPK